MLEAPPLDPLYSFTREPGRFVKRHRLGTCKEFMLEKAAIDEFNRSEHSFKAWPIVYLRKMKDSAVLLFFVKPSEHDAMLPKEGEDCDIFIPEFPTSRATRVDNPCTLWRVRAGFLARCLAFEVHLQNIEKIAKKFPGLRQRKSIPSQLIFLEVTFELRVSTSTRNAELRALGMLDQARQNLFDGLSQWQINAYKFFVRLSGPYWYMRLFSYFSHMRELFETPETTSPKLVELFQTLNDQQKHAFTDLLNNVPNGICIIHGCPGAGKTHFNLVVAAAMQWKDEILHSQDQSPTPWKNKILYLIDINRPLTDAANKMARLYAELDLTKECNIDGSCAPRIAIRMYCWSYEKLTASRNRLKAEWEELNHRMEESGQPEVPQDQSNAQENGNVPTTTTQSTRGPLERFRGRVDDSEQLQIHDFASAFRSAEHTMRARANQPEGGVVAPTLDEAAWAMYERFKDTKYARLRTIRHHMDLVRSTDLGYLENSELETLYRDTLQDADMVFTTPVSASKFSSSMFSPTLVIFDEAPHSRELSTLIALAHFNPAAWILSGDIRQTKPYVRSIGSQPCKDKYGPQLQVSMMERAHRQNPNRPSLNINHRAHGGLEKLASLLFYFGRMIPAIDPSQPGAIPPSTAHLRDKYIMPMKRNEGSKVSRLLISLKDPGGACCPDKRSWYHPGHQRWVMELVLELLKDRHFRRTNGEGPGTILIMAPYKEAAIRYRKAIRELKNLYSAFSERVVEARSVDTAQGHEADAVILDLVRQRPTPHLEEANRLCVGLTRARQCEFVLMHKDLIRNVQGDNTCLAKMVSTCKELGEFVSDPPPLADILRSAQ